MSLIEKPVISDCGTFHLDYSGRPLYAQRFNEVLAFHRVNDDWIAPVQLGTDAFHIDVKGQPVYKSRYARCFGFYHKLAAVIDVEGWHHIKRDGVALYTDRYSFAGNYQENAVVVMDSAGNYFHLDTEGRPLYDSRWKYCGDYRDGIAVVQSADGLSTHILKDGTFLHGKWFVDLDVYHKGLARAKTTAGWCHIDKTGISIYPQHFLSVEPFYNGFSRCEDSEGALLIIDEAGKTQRFLRKGSSDKFAELSADMVGYWKTFTIASAVRLGIFDNLPGPLAKIAKDCACHLPHLERMLKALMELDLVFQQDDGFEVTEKGSYLCSTNAKTLVDAADEYAGDLLKRWERLPAIVRGEPVASNIFIDVADNRDRVRSHHRMLASYAQHDYSLVAALLPIQRDSIVLDAGGGTGTLAFLVQQHFPNSHVYLGDIATVLAASDFHRKLELDFFKPWTIKADQIILARVLHDWSDDDAIRILTTARQALNADGCILILEMLLDKGSCSGALCDLHLLSVTGGKERNIDEFNDLAKSAGLKLNRVISSASLVSVIVLSPRGSDE